MKYARLYLALSTVCLFLITTRTAHASTIFTLTADACTGTCGVSPYGTITLSQTATNTVTVTETLKAGEVFAKTGAGSALEFNVTGPFTISNLTSGFTSAGADSASAFGSFLASITCSSCSGGNPGNPAGPLSFTITGTGLTEASFIANAGGYYFASDLRGTNGNTGNVASKAGVPDTTTTTTSTSVAPEPSTFALLGTGLLGAVGAIRKRARH